MTSKEFETEYNKWVGYIKARVVNLKTKYGLQYHTIDELMSYTQEIFFEAWIDFKRKPYKLTFYTFLTNRLNWRLIDICRALAPMGVRLSRYHLKNIKQYIPQKHGIKFVDFLENYHEKRNAYNVDTFAIVNDKILSEKLIDLLNELSLKERSIVMMYYFEYKTHTEIGNIYGVTRSRISQKLKKIIEKLRKLLKNKTLQDFID